MKHMLRIILIIAFSCTCTVVWAAEVDMEVIKQIESSGDAQAYNKGSGARGHYQITKICLDDYNMFHSRKYRLNDLFNPVINETIGHWYMNVRIPQLLRHYGKVDSVRNRLISYNCGISCVGKKLPRETINYIDKYNRRLK